MRNLVGQGFPQDLRNLQHSDEWVCFFDLAETQHTNPGRHATPDVPDVSGIGCRFPGLLTTLHFSCVVVAVAAQPSADLDRDCGKVDLDLGGKLAVGDSLPPSLPSSPPREEVSLSGLYK